MKEENSHIYTAADIHKYLTGKLSDIEMHAIENASLNDPLLADAIEGFKNSDFLQSPNDYSSLQTEINSLKNRVASYPNNNYNWWKVAAAAIILVGTSITFYLINTKHAVNTQASIIEQQQFVKNNQVKDTIAFLPEKSNLITLEHHNNNKSVIKTTAERKSPIASLNTRLTADAATSAPLASSISPIVETEEKSNQVLFRNSKSEYYEKKKSAVSFSGKITDTHNNGIAYATIIINHQQQSTTDGSGVFNIELPDSSITLEIISPKFYSKTITVYPNQIQVIELTFSKINFKKETSDTGKRSQIEILYNKGAEPVMGWPTYLHYLEDQLSFSTYDDGRKVTGQMIVQFTLDNNFNSTPSDFYFEKSIDEDVDNAVRELIQNGPEWKKNDSNFKSSIIKLSITF